LKSLRGSALDPFGYNPERKMERALAQAYPKIIDGVMADLTSDSLSWAIEVARVFDKIRGFGHIKERNLQAAITELQGLARGTRIEPLVTNVADQAAKLMPLGPDVQVSGQQA
jgi:indolepyruvate ferredoxin oxidoreductase